MSCQCSRTDSSYGVEAGRSSPYVTSALGAPDLRYGILTTRIKNSSIDCPSY